MAAKVAAIFVFNHWEPKDRWTKNEDLENYNYLMSYRQVHGLIRPPYRPLQHAVNPSMGAWRKHPVFNSCICLYGRLWWNQI